MLSSDSNLGTHLALFFVNPRSECKMLKAVPAEMSNTGNVGYRDSPVFSDEVSDVVDHSYVTVGCHSGSSKKFTGLYGSDSKAGLAM